MPIPSERKMLKGPRWSNFQQPLLQTSGETFGVVRFLQWGCRSKFASVGERIDLNVLKSHSRVPEFPYTGAEIHLTSLRHLRTTCLDLRQPPGLLLHLCVWDNLGITIIGGKQLAGRS